MSVMIDSSQTKGDRELPVTHPYSPGDDDPVSTFEELDSFEIPARRAEVAARTYRREAFIGIGVLVVLAAIAFSQWRQTQAVQDTYHAGARAAAAYDWPAAHKAFSSIHGYWDADLRAADAAKMITYTLALSGT